MVASIPCGGVGVADKRISLAHTLQADLGFPEYSEFIFTMMYNPNGLNPPLKSNGLLGVYTVDELHHILQTYAYYKIDK